MDEKSMILEQERQEKARKQKKHKKFKWIVGIIIVILIIGVIWYVGWGRNLLASNENTEVEIQVATGQSVVYAQITAINGNEITYAVAEKVDVKMPEIGRDNAKVEAQGQRGEGMLGGTGEMPDMGSMPEGMSEMPDMGSMPEGMSEMPDMGSMPEGMSEMPDMGSMPEGTGKMPDMGSMPEGMSEMPDMGSMPEGTVEMPDMGQRGDDAQDNNRKQKDNATATEMQNMFSYGDSVYMVGTETNTTYIPVGTDVITKLGTVTTFSRLSAGDLVALVTEGEGEEQVIMAVYIIG